MVLQKMLETEPELRGMRQVAVRSSCRDVFLNECADAPCPVRQGQQIRAELRGDDFGHMLGLSDRIDLFFHQRAERDAVFNPQQGATFGTRRGKD
jgi:hypothetical protein